MTHQVCMDKLQEYYGVKDIVMQEISSFTRHLDENSLNTLWESMKYNVSPSKRIGVNDIWLVCRDKNLPVKKSEPVRLPVFDVNCDVCHYNYRWKQAVAEQDEKNGIYEKCPRCGFPYYETWNEKEYTRDGRDNGADYRALVARWKKSYTAAREKQNG